ncbi:MAG: hypothetical protein NUV44_10875 [Candidatus Scalindua sp.]|nr:hypothetical protein [Candidatus Scalindua sp.]
MNNQETKKCKVCGAIFYKTKHNTDYNWSVKKYCDRDDCKTLGRAIERLNKLGYKIEKPL